MYFPASSGTTEAENSRMVAAFHGTGSTLVFQIFNGINCAPTQFSRFVATLARVREFLAPPQPTGNYTIALLPQKKLNMDTKNHAYLSRLSWALHRPTHFAMLQGIVGYVWHKLLSSKRNEPYPANINFML